MERAIVFDNTFTVVSESGEEITFEYFLYEGIPVIKYNNKGFSFCTDFKRQGWTSKDTPDFEKKSLIFLCCTDDPIFDWCSIYHELGHIINNHQFDGKGRLDRVKEGVVIPYELEADQNVLKKMGREKTELWLESLISKLTKEIEMRELAKREGWLKPQGEKLLDHFLLGRDEIILRLKYL